MGNCNFAAEEPDRLCVMKNICVILRPAICTPEVHVGSRSRLLLSGGQHVLSPLRLDCRLCEEAKRKAFSMRDMQPIVLKYRVQIFCQRACGKSMSTSTCLHKQNLVKVLVYSTIRRTIRRGLYDMT